MALTVAFAQAGYLVPLLGVTQVVAGALLLANRFVPLALVHWRAFWAVLVP